MTVKDALMEAVEHMEYCASVGCAGTLDKTRDRVVDLPDGCPSDGPEEDKCTACSARDWLEKWTPLFGNVDAQRGES